MGNSRRKLNPEFPDDLVMEILIRLPRKQVARCKCVCKLWRWIIRSAHFKDVYGMSSQCGLLLHRFQPQIGYLPILNIYYSRICDEQEELEFISQHKLGILDVEDWSGMTPFYRMTKIANGLLCVEYNDGGWLSIYNVCTGERMRVPGKLPHNNETIFVSGNGEVTRPKFHLGYDPSSRRYKILRLTADYPVHAHIMTLKPSSSSSTWELINFGADDYIPPTHAILAASSKNKISPNDGFLCWFLPEEDLILFDLSKERFQKISLHARFVHSILYHGEGFVRAQFIEHKRRLVVSLWTISQIFSIHTHFCRRLECFVMDDDEGKRWSEHFIDFPPQLDQEKAVFVVPNGTLHTISATELVVINTTENDVYCYDHTSKMLEAQFRIGKLPDVPVHQVVAHTFPDGHSYYTRYSSDELSCLCHPNTLHLPLDDILSASK